MGPKSRMAENTMTIATQPLRIAIVGAGQIGSTFAFQLSRQGGHDVTVIARPGSDRLTQLRRDAAIVKVDGHRADVRVLDALDEQTPYDLVIVTVLAHQVDGVLPGLARSAAACIQFMFNVFDPERLGQAVGAGRCTFGMPFVQAKLDTNGRLAATIGAGGQKSIMGHQHWVDVFNASGLPARLERNMPLWLRCHVPLCVAFESASIAGVRRGGGASLRQAIVLAHGVHACFDLIETLGFSVYPRSKKIMYRLPASGLAAVFWSLSRVRSFRDLLATGERECRSLVDVMMKAAASGQRQDLLSQIEAMKPAVEALRA